MIEAFVGLGSNLGDRLANLGAAADRLAWEPGFQLRRISLAYESEPIGPPQPHYLNAVAHVGTLLSPRATLQRLRAIEELLGRVRREHCCQEKAEASHRWSHSRAGPSSASGSGSVRRIGR